VSLPLKRFKTLGFPVLAWLTLCSVPWCHAADYYVYMTPDLTFDPDPLQIQYGDTVTWQNVDFTDFHNARSDDAYWDTGELDFGETSVPFQFKIVGKFPYRDTSYYPFGMTGTIVVTAPPPLLTNPARLGNGSFQFTVTNLTLGTTNVIQASTNLVNWTNLYTNVALTTGFLYIDSAASNFKPQRFYRASVLP